MTVDVPRSVLIIDDNVDDRELCKRALLAAIRPIPAWSEAGSAESGLVAMSEELPDCVLLDYSLPGRNGLDVLKRIRVQYPFLPVIMLTGQGNETVAVQAMKEGAQDYITKSSIAPESLERTVRSAIRICAAEQRIRAQRESLEVFTRALAHDLKEPIRTLTAFSRLIEDDDESPEERANYLKYIQNAADRMGMLVNSVFQYIQLDGPRNTYDQQCDMTAALDNAIQNLARAIAENGAVIEHAPLPTVRANPTQMMQVLQNLVGNAILHNDRPIRVNVSAELQDNCWHFCVADNGCGFGAEHSERVFEPFKRLTLTDGCSGLGLSICRKIIAQHGGEIWAESNPGCGARFVFSIPRAEFVEESNVQPD